MKTQPNAARRRIVIVNADDFGASLQTNQAIIRAFDKGLISSTTVMTNMPAFEDACQLARQRKLQFSIGLHVNLTLGKPLTAEIAACPGLCDANGSFRPARRILWLSAKEAAAVEGEITGQVLACEKQGITPTHLDSHNHIHTQHGIATVCIRVAKRSGIRVIRLGRNCGPFRDGASLIHRTLARAYRSARNAHLRFHGLDLTQHFGDAQDVADVLRTTTADVEIMVHPRLDRSGRLVDLDGEDLESRIRALHIPRADMCSYSAAAHIVAKQGWFPLI